MKQLAFTICSSNYLSRALILTRSLARYHPRMARAIFLCDYKDPEVEQKIRARDPDVIIYWYDDITIVRPLHQAFQYDIMELNTAIKPACFRFIIETLGVEYAIYLDPDIKLFAPLTACLTALSSGYSMVVTPHITAPIDNTANPNEVSFLSSGIYNFGFFAVRATENTSKLLRWWEQQLQDLCIVDRTKGYFVDQKWMNILPALFDDVYILGHQGYNVAYWNLMQRPLGKDGDAITVGGDPLVFFHFSGLDPKNKTKLSRHENRYDLAQIPMLRDIVSDYIDEVHANFHNDFSATSYSFGKFTDGRPISKHMRVYYLNSPDAQAIGKDDPFEHLSTFFDEVEPACAHLGYPRISRLLWQVWLSRRDISVIWNINEVEDRKNLLDWFSSQTDSKDWDHASRKSATRIFMESK